ncbi:dTDP-glucose 4,6-dehydratase [Chitinispirillales bacterium ANBcel5]|uniref:dTDP-glucose 4,6-dehydratase n=1 Tax=Cellulosispirillum alkaliphilum TaxID=3039283 RepID=UPI002A54A8B5|nr:dTDP-glucose 4,6-dehydratase [Chitinispirillales bacterium ANBcel5]
MKTVLVTGGAGFIGSNFIDQILSTRDDLFLVNFDALTYAGNLDNLIEVSTNPRYTFIKGSICDPDSVTELFKKYDFDYVVHFAAESHVDRSILGPAEFVNTNVIGTQVLLHTAKDAWQAHFGDKLFIHVSTDEVYGSLGRNGYFTEETPLAPNSPYSASKAGSDLLVRSYFKTFNFPSIITRCSNNYGPYQYPEKLIPLMIINAMNDKALPVYGDGLNVRDWLFVKDHCNALQQIMEKGTPGEVYNIGGRNEKSNIEIVHKILNELGKPKSLVNYVKDRPGHDKRYAIDASKIESELGWQPSISLEDGLALTIEWYKNNSWWWEKILNTKNFGNG